MNAASQLLRLLAVLGAIAAGVLFYMTNGKIADLSSQLSSAKQTADSTQAKLTKAMADNQDTVTSTNKAIADYDGQLKAAKQNNDTLASSSEEAQKAVTADEDQIKALKRQVADAEAKTADVQKVADSVAGLNAQIADLQTQITNLNATIAEYKVLGPKAAPDASKPGTAISSIDSGPAAPVIPTNLSAKEAASILSVDTKQWLIALDVGSDKDIKKDSELYLTVNGDNLAVVKVLDLTRSTATASIISTQDIQPANFSKIATKGLKISYQHAE